MCFSPRHIVNPSTWIDPNGTQSLFIDVPCGHCSECIITYRNEWRNRSYYESLGTFLSGDDSFILFDTLTYRNGSLPHLSDFISVPRHLDFPCFSKWDLDHFFALLRRKLRKYDVEHNLRYFIACEYGDDIRFSRRPHYHVLFFVKCNIDPCYLSRVISDSWIHGRTDGVVYRGRSYVQNECVFRSMVQSAKFSVNYVTKYCTKQFSFLSMVEKRLNALCSYDFQTYLLAKDYVKLQHYQSKGFGHDYLIDIVGKDTLLDQGKFKIIGKDGIFRYVNLHKSLQRKLLYDYSRDENGCVHWKLNKDGFVYKKKFFERNVSFLLSRVAGHDSYSYYSIRLDILKMFFVDSRLRPAKDVDDLIDNSFNVDYGLRNYSSVDYSFIRKAVYTSKDYGSKKLGFQHAQLHICNSIDSVDDTGAITLDSLKKVVGDYSSLMVQKYNASRLANGDGKLEVLKLLHRLEHIHKNQFAYV